MAAPAFEEAFQDIRAIGMALQGRVCGEHAAQVADGV